MKRFNYLLSIFAISFLLVFTSCSEDDDKDTAIEYKLTESLFSSATNPIQTNINTGAMAHNGDATASGTMTFRDVYTNMTDVSGTAKPGDIITKYVYGKDSTGAKGALMVAFAMVKQEAGNGDDDGNWYWYMLPNGNDTDFSTVAKVDPQSNCSGCHSGGSSDYRFVFGS
jgi:hypothetical protein